MPRRISSHVQGNLVAYVALFVALGGTAVASSLKLAANSVGTAQLKNGAVTGKKVAGQTLTGANIRLSTLGTVPRAAEAGHATSATDAATLGGQPAGSFQSRVSGTCAAGSAIASIDASGTVACHEGNLTQMLGGIQSTGSSGATHYFAPQGLTPSPLPTSETDGLGAPAVAGTAGNLDVGIFALQPFSITFTLDVNDAATALKCTIPAGGTTCQDSTDTAAVPAGALVDVASQGSFFNSTQVAIGWTDLASP